LASGYWCCLIGGFGATVAFFLRFFGFLGYSVFVEFASSLPLDARVRIPYFSEKKCIEL
jgi:hypothetical protein